MRKRAVAGAQTVPLSRRGATLDFDGDDNLIEVPPDWDNRFIQLVLITVVLGLVMSFSASYPLASRPDKDLIPGDAFHYFRPHLAYAIAGLCLMTLTARLRPRDLERFSLPAFALSLGLMVVTIVVYWVLGTTTRGSRLFLEIGPIRFQPSEFAKLFYVVYMASLLSQGPWEGGRSRAVRRRAIGATVLFCSLLVVQKDQGMMVLVFSVGLGLCFLSGLRWHHLLAALGLAFGGAATLALSDPERRERIWAWIDPVNYRDGAGFHVLSMLVATSRGWVNGLGLGMSPEKWRQMPEPHTDSIFCVMAGELGLIGCALFLGVLGWLIWRCFEAGRWSRDGFGYFLACGIGILYGAQALINMFVATNMMPVTGLTLPFISYGGTSLISCLMGAGMVLAIFRHNPALRRE
jgi:cell division protein FtsW